MLKMMKTMMVILVFLGLSGCTSKEEEILPPVMNVQEVAKAYMDAIKAQDGTAMSKYTKDGLGDDFRIRDQDVSELELSVEQIQEFYHHMLNFDYTLADEVLGEDKQSASVEVRIQAYNIDAVLKQGVEANKKEFAKISTSKASDEEKNKQITDILLDQFVDSSKDYTGTYTLYFTLIENEWKVDSIGDEFYNILLNITE